MKIKTPEYFLAAAIALTACDKDGSLISAQSDIPDSTVISDTTADTTGTIDAIVQLSRDGILEERPSPTPGNIVSAKPTPSAVVDLRAAIKNQCISAANAKWTALRTLENNGIWFDSLAAVPSETYRSCLAQNGLEPKANLP